MDLKEFESKYNTQEQCLSYLSKLYLNGFCCEKCQNGNSWITKDFKFKCKGANCNYQVTVTAGTMFYKSRIPINLWFKAMWYMTSNKKNVTASWLHKELRIGSNNTANKLYKILQHLMIHSNQEKLQGTVEVYWDEVIVPKSSAKSNLLIAIAVEMNEDKIEYIRSDFIESVTPENILKFLKNNVVSGSTLKCKQWNDIYARDYNQAPYRWLNAQNAFKDLKNWLSCRKYIKYQDTHTYYLKRYCVTDKKYESKITFQELLHTATKFPPLANDILEKIMRH